MGKSINAYFSASGVTKEIAENHPDAREYEILFNTETQKTPGRTIEYSIYI